MGVKGLNRDNEVFDDVAVKQNLKQISKSILKVNTMTSIAQAVLIF